MHGDGVDVASTLGELVLSASDGARVEGVLHGDSARRQTRHRRGCHTEEHQEQKPDPTLGRSASGSSCEPCPCQLAADVGKSIFTRLIGVKVISGKHRTTGGDGAVLGGSLGLLAGVVARLVQTPGV